MFDPNTMMRICPKPIPWIKAHQHLLRFAESQECTPPSPPKPLILSGWDYSNDIEKMRRWEDMVEWARNNNCLEIVKGIPDNQFYKVDEPTTYEIGPLGRPMPWPWNFEARSRPSAQFLERKLEELVSEWPRIIGKQLAAVTRPIVFTGKKARRLLVRADSQTTPPWGGWTRRSNVESERRTFTTFRSAINKAISPHEVDHVDFVVTDAAEQDALTDA